MREPASVRGRLAALVLVGAAYFLAGKLGLSLAFLHVSASPVWPPTGIAIAALLLLGARVWPAILVGAFLVNITTAGSAATSLAIAIGNTLEGLVAAALVTRFAGGVQVFARPRGVFLFAALAGALSAAVSATVGVTTLTLSGYADRGEYSAIWLTWWLGDCAGALVVAPLLMLWASGPAPEWSGRRAIEAAALGLVLVLFGLIVFSGIGPEPLRGKPLAFLTIPFPLWAAFRFGPREATTATAILSAIAIGGALQGFGPFARGDPNQTLLLLQAFLATVSVTTLAVAAVVAERRRAQRELRNSELAYRQMFAEAEQANTAKDAFLATLSHELRTPLTAILGWTRMLQGGQLAAAQATHALETIERNVRRQTQLINDLLDISRIVTGKLGLDSHRLELVPIVEDAVGGLRGEATDKHLQLLTALDSSAGRVWGDPVRLHQVVVNLLSNAVKFTPAGGHVEVLLERIDSRARLTVRDSGKGIPAALLPHIFDRFRQADSSLTRRHGGLGLGLAIVRELVHLHGGTVEAESPGEGQGAIFRVYLPLVGAGDAGAPRLRDVRHAGQATPPIQPQPGLLGVRVLVVDDDPDTLDLLSTTLGPRHAGASVTTARSVVEGLKAFDRLAPDVVVTDLAMPELDGYVLLREIQARGSGQATPVVAITAHAGADDRERALAAGFVAYLPKPLEPAQLVGLLSRALGRATS